MAWPVAIPVTVSEPAHAALSAQLRFDRLAGRSLPLDQIDAAIAEGAKAINETRRALKALRQVRQEAKAEKAKSDRATAKYARDEKRLKVERQAEITGQSMAAAMSGAAA
jgi:hypothetical protein